MLNTKMIGSKITEARKKINISQAQLAELLFISSQAVGKWERGESMPDIVTFNRLAEILGVDLNYFSEGLERVDIGSDIYRMAPVENLDKQTAELTSSNAAQLTSVKQKEKPRWDMSRGNWVDADFSGLKNLHEKFSSSNMQRCLFIGSDMSGLLLKSNNVEGCDFSSSDISSSHIQNSNLASNIFKDCSLKETEFLGSNINSCDFSGANFTGVTFQKNNNVDSCDFSGADFSGSHIQNSNFANNLFKGCSLKETEFLESYIYGCDFTAADFTGVVVKSGGFTGVTIKSGDLEENTIADAVWNRTSFINTQIADIVFTGTLEDCYFENCVFTRVTFQNATLINTFFKNKSLKRIRFIECKTDKLTYEFLKNGKADLTGITLLTS